MALRIVSPLPYISIVVSLAQTLHNHAVFTLSWHINKGFTSPFKIVSPKDQKGPFS